MGFDCAWILAPCDADTMIASLFRQPRIVRVRQEVGRVLTMFLATHSGSAGFSVYEDGERVRHVLNDDGRLTVAGRPSPRRRAKTKAAKR